MRNDQNIYRDKIDRKHNDIQLKKTKLKIEIKCKKCHKMKINKK